MKKVLQFLGFMILLYLATRLTEYFVRNGRPRFQDEIIQKFQSDNYLLNRVGSYQNHEFSYPTNELDMDSLHFELIIFGSKKCIIYEGCALKKNSDIWEVKRMKSKIE